MSLGLFLIPTLGGYWLLTHWNYTRFRAVRDSGYQVLFKSAFAGAILFVAAYVGVALLNHYLPWTETEWAAQVPVEYSDAAVLSVLLGVLFPKAVNRFYPALKAAEAAAEKDGNLIELLIMRSMSEQRAVERRIIELTLRSGKSYIGFGHRNDVEDYEDADVSLVPVASGYRRKDTQELQITTNYARVMLESEDVDFSDFRIVIPMSEIISARTFIPEAYKRFQAAASQPSHGAGGAEAGAEETA